MLGDIIVHGKPRILKTIVVSDQELRDRDARYTVIEALENKQHPTIAFNIDFAPRSSVMTASGRHKVEIIAGAMSSVDQKMGFLIHVSEQNSTANQGSLNLDRARAIVSYMRLKKPIQNRLLVSEKAAPSFLGRSNAAHQAKTNVFFKSLDEPISLLGAAH